MTSKRITSLLASAIAVAVVLLGAPAFAQLSDPHATRIRASAGLEYAQRSLSIDYGDGAIDFAAPMYPGLEVAIDLYPVAFFAPDSAASGLSVGFETSRHRLNTLTTTEFRGVSTEIDVPTRHASTGFILRYEHPIGNRVQVGGHFAWRTLAYSLGQNTLLSNSFYRGPEIGALARVRVVEGLDLGLVAAVLPATSLGSTVAPFGDDGGALGLKAEFDARYRMKFGAFASLGARYLRYSTTWSSGGSESASGSDGFLSFLFRIGYSI